MSMITYMGLLLFIVSNAREAKLLGYNLEEKRLRNVETSLSLGRCGDSGSLASLKELSIIDNWWWTFSICSIK